MAGMLGLPAEQRAAGILRLCFPAEKSVFQCSVTAFAPEVESNNGSNKKEQCTAKAQPEIGVSEAGHKLPDNAAASHNEGIAKLRRNVFNVVAP